MKNLFKLLLVLMSFTAFAQTLPQKFNTPVQFNVVSEGTKHDSIMVWPTSKILKHVKKSDFLESGSVPAMMQGSGTPTGNPDVASWLAGVLPREALYYDNVTGNMYTYDTGSTSWTAVGGTVDDSNFVHKNTDETINDVKTFTDAPIFQSLTEGRIPFSGSGSAIADSNKLLWDDTNSKMELNGNNFGVRLKENLNNSYIDIVNSGLGSSSLHFKSSYGSGKVLMNLRNPTGTNSAQLAVGDVPTIPTESQFYVYGGENGANIDMRGKTTRDEANMDFEGSDWETLPNSLGFSYFGTNYSLGGTTLGYPKQRLANIRFYNADYALFTTTHPSGVVPFRFGINNTEIANLGQYGWSYQANYASNNTSNPRWLVDKGYTDLNLLHTTGNETKAGKLTFANTTNPVTNGIVTTNSGADTTNGSITVTNSSTGNGIVVNNSSTGNGIKINNTGTNGDGIDITGGANVGVRVEQTGIGATSFSANTQGDSSVSFASVIAAGTSSMGFRSEAGNGNGIGFSARGVSGHTGNLFQAINGGDVTFRVIKEGDVFGTNFKASKGLYAEEEAGVNQFRTYFYNNQYQMFDFKSTDTSVDNFGSVQIYANPEESIIISKNNGDNSSNTGLSINNEIAQINSNNSTFNNIFTVEPYQTTSSQGFRTDWTYGNTQLGTEYYNGMRQFFVNTTGNGTDFPTGQSATMYANPEEGINLTAADVDNSGISAIYLSPSGGATISVTNAGETNNTTFNGSGAASNKGWTTTFTNGTAEFGTKYAGYDEYRQLIFTTTGDGGDLPASLGAGIIINPEDGAGLSSNNSAGSSYLTVNGSNANFGVNGGEISMLASGSGTASQITLPASGIPVINSTEGQVALKYGTGYKATLWFDGLTSDVDVTIPNESGIVKFNKYRVYTMNLSQSGTSAPAIDFTFENSLGFTPTIAYVGVGHYTFTSTGNFTEAKTATQINSSSGGRTEAYKEGGNNNVIHIFTYDSTGTLANGVLNKCLFEIRVYN